MNTILLVEDDRSQRALYEQELADAGYRVVLAKDGREALEKIEDESVDVVIMDIFMPGMDGIEAMNRILARDKRMPVIINTAYSTYKDSFMTWSADAYVVKSSDLTDLKETIARLLKAREQ